MSGLRLNAFGVSDTGIVRVANEDSMLLRNSEGLWAVADGMGGHAQGKWASSQLVATLSECPIGLNFEANLQAIGGAVQAANTRILAYGQENAIELGTTLAALHISPARRFAALWAGDSRVYLMRHRALTRLTRDHTRVQDLVEEGALTPEQAETHANRSVLSRAVGVEAELALEAVTDAVEAHDIFLLCSDGLTGLVSDAEIAAGLLRAAPDSAARQLLQLALNRGAPDNVTAIVIACEDTTQSVRRENIDRG